VTDGYGDNGIDAIFFEPADKTLHLVQSKWNDTHTGSVDNGSVLKYLQGVRDLLNSKYEKFNAKVQNRRKEIDRAISQATKVHLAFVYSGSGSFSVENQDSINDFITDVDETRDLVSSSILNQPILYSYLSTGLQGAPISADLQLLDWGWIDSPIRAYYGKASAADLAKLHEKHGPKIFSKNIRMFLGDEGSVNSGIIDTIDKDPENFWYYNNGITILANSVRRKAIGGTNRESGQFELEGLSIVNGAQTVGSLSAAASKFKDKIDVALIMVRLIQLEGSPDGFASAITRSNNTQNRIDARNFVALDSNQERLKSEFLVDGVDYEFRQGEIEHSSNTRLGLVEATVALACTDADVSLSTQAKREVGRLWEDISRPPYKRLFNSGMTSELVWSRVTAFRRIDQAVSAMQIQSTGKANSVAVHGNRFLAYAAYRLATTQGAAADLSNFTDQQVGELVSYIFARTTEDIQANYPDNYLASLFKNQTKCREIAGRVLL
jgi:hypothetical protein